jgi:hypothetical protein
MARPGNPAILAGAALVGIVLIIVGILLAVGTHPIRGGGLVVLGLIALAAGYLVGRRARTGRS